MWQNAPVGQNVTEDAQRRGDFNEDDEGGITCKCLKENTAPLYKKQKQPRVLDL